MEPAAQTVGLEAIPISAIRASNAQCSCFDGLVAVFVGGTDGVGRATAMEFFKRTTRPKAYIVGRQVADSFKFWDLEGLKL
jgi:hypothetical protein